MADSLKDGRASARKQTPLGPTRPPVDPARASRRPDSKTVPPDKERRPPDRETRSSTINRRQEARIQDRNVDDELLMGKHLPADLSTMFDSKVPGPEDDFVPPDWLNEATEEVFSSPAPPPKPPPVKFATDPDSLEANAAPSEECDCDLLPTKTPHSDTGPNSDQQPS